MDVLIMGKRLTIILSIFGFIAGIFFFLYNNIKNNISAKIDDFHFGNLKGGMQNPTVDVNLKMTITNASAFSFTLSALNIDIYNAKTFDFVASSNEIERIKIEKGMTPLNIDFKDVSVYSNADLFNPENEEEKHLKVLINFKVFGIFNVNTEQTLII